MEKMHKIKYNKDTKTAILYSFKKNPKEAGRKSPDLFIITEKKANGNSIKGQKRIICINYNLEGNENGI